MPRTRTRGPFTLVYSADHGNDLPPKWDGEPIAWDPWETCRTSLDWHLTASERACSECGSTKERPSSIGREPRPGGKRGFLRLYATRCPDCMHDTVYEPSSRQLWDLELSDYSDEGSTA